MSDLTFFGIGAVVALVLIGMTPTLAQSVPPPAQDPMLANGPPIWDANHDGVYTCDEWKKYAERIFASADRNHDGTLSPSGFEAGKPVSPARLRQRLMTVIEDLQSKRQAALPA